MASSLVMSLIGAASVAAALLVGCGDNDAKPVSSKQGESCVRTADCVDGLSCIANVCYSTAPTGSGGDAGEGSTPVVGPALGGEGESCTSRKDCADGLACFNQRCTSAATGDGGATGAPTAQLGDRGETCRTNADCATDLVCVPSTVSAGVGVCDITSFGIVPTGKVCGGECAAADDCCQLPQLEQSAVGIKSCADLTALIATNAVDCAATQVAASLGAHLCFLDSAYCAGCGATTWKCTDNTCVYNVACTVAAGADAPKGCPVYSRLGHLLPDCNAKGLKCTGQTVADLCTTDASCTGQVVADSLGADSCSDGECTCYAGNHECYRKCARDLDCAAGRICDKDSSLCVPDSACVTDTQCALKNGSLDYTCRTDTHTCAHSCTTDRDCSGTGHVSGNTEEGTYFNGSVCSNGFCEYVTDDCTDDSQCPLGATNGYKTFCIDAPALAPDTSVTSAITN